MNQKKAIVVVSFGTSIAQAFQTGIQPIEESIARRFPEYKVISAFTSNIIIKKIKRVENRTILTPLEAITSLAEEGYEEVLVLSTHVIPGFEYEKVSSSVEKAQAEFPSCSIKLSLPLFYTNEDYEDICTSFQSTIEDLEEGEALVFMGHGTDHFAHASYFRFLYEMRKLSDRVYLTVVENGPDFDETAQELKKDGIKKAVLKPLMIVAGDHAMNDMASDDEDSLKSILEAQQIECSCHIVGLGSHEVIQNSLASHLDCLLK